MNITRIQQKRERCSLDGPHTPQGPGNPRDTGFVAGSAEPVLFRYPDLLSGRMRVPFSSTG